MGLQANMGRRQFASALHEYASVSRSSAVFLALIACIGRKRVPRAGRRIISPWAIAQSGTTDLREIGRFHGWSPTVPLRQEPAFPCQNIWDTWPSRDTGPRVALRARLKWRAGAATGPAQAPTSQKRPSPCAGCARSTWSGGGRVHVELQPLGQRAIPAERRHSV